MRDRAAALDSPRTEAAVVDAADETRWYANAVAEFGSALARLAAAYEFDRAQQQDLLQEGRRLAGAVGFVLDGRAPAIRLRGGSSGDSSAQTCAAYHQRYLERQRDIALSWPWGIGLAIPGFVLTVMGLGVGAQNPNWIFSAVMTGVFLFMYMHW
jgi:hypothetical protein